MSEHPVRRSSRFQAVSSLLVGLACVGIGWAAEGWHDVLLLVGGGLLVAIGVVVLLHPLVFEVDAPDGG